MEPAPNFQTIELLKAAKPLFDGADTWITASVGAVSAIGGALAAFFPTYWMAKRTKKEQAKSTIFQLYAEIKATMEVERHRNYTESVQEIIQSLKAGRIREFDYKVEVPDERFVIYKANLPNLGLLPPKLQVKTVLLYQTMEAIVQDIKPGGILNANKVGVEPFEELLRFLTTAKRLGEEILSEIEAMYPDIT